MVGQGGARQGEAGLRLLNQSELDLNHHGPPTPTRVTWPWVSLSLSFLLGKIRSVVGKLRWDTTGRVPSTLWYQWVPLSVQRGGRTPLW